MSYVQGYNDIHVIPDKHNTGVDIITCTIPVPEVNVTLENGIKFRDDDGTMCYMDFNKPPNNTASGVYVFENIDFSSRQGWVGYGNASGYQGTGIKLIFNNCKFYSFHANNTNELIECEFNNCSFRSIANANMVLNDCFIGGQSEFEKIGFDAVMPGENSTFNNCYIADIVAKTEEPGTGHLDGMQTLKPQNLYFYNCRWEVPDINYTYKQGGFSYAVYLQSDNIENVILDHCYINGGGYYSISVTDTDPVNCRIIEPFIGYCYYGWPFYPSSSGSKTNSAEAVTENPRFHDGLYVSSVWKDDSGFLHFMTTNDTGEDRTLTAVTNAGTTTYSIPRTYRLTEYEADTKDFADLPIDLEYVIEETDIDYVVFYESDTQIRYVNFGGESNDVTVKALFVQICNAIRAKDGSTSLINHTDIPRRIQSLSGEGGITPSGSIELSANGTYDVTSYTQAVVNVPSESSGELPSNVKSGVLYLESDSANAITIEHGCNSIPTKIVCIPLDFISKKGTVGGIYTDGAVIGISSTSNEGEGVKSYSTAVVAIANVNDISFDFKPRSASYPLIGGYNYLWIAIV